MLIWTDLETCGTDPDKDALLEVGAIVTDDTLNEVTRFHRIVYWEHAQTVVDLIEHYRAFSNCFTEVVNRLREEGLPRVDPYVLEMHDKNGLWKDVVYGQARDTVDRDFAALIKAAQVELPPREGYATGLIDKPQLAGSTISFDRGFIAKYLKRSIKELHYRNLDVSSFNETGRRFWKDLYAARPNNKEKAHRGMADIEESIRVYKHYLAHLTYTVPTPPNPDQLTLPEVA